MHTTFLLYCILHRRKFLGDLGEITAFTPILDGTCTCTSSSPLYERFTSVQNDFSPARNELSSLVSVHVWSVKTWQLDHIQHCTVHCFYLFSVSPWRRANARNVRPYYPYWQYTDHFIFRFVSLLCLRSTLRLFHTCMFSYHNHYNNNHLKKHSNIIIQNIIRKGYLAGDFLTALTKSPSSLVTTKMKNKNSQKYKQDFSKAHFWLVLKSSS